jgi:hypothetical protein
MVAATPASKPAERVDLRRLLWVGPLIIVSAVIANSLIRLAAVALLQPDPAFQPLTPGPPAFLTFVGVLGAVVVFGLLAWLTRRPITLFRRIAVIVLLLSFVPDVLMLITGFNPGTTVPNVLVLMLMHVVAWAISVFGLTRFTRA